MRFIPRRRKDFDSIFLVAPEQAATQIIPLLRFYYANNIPIYATSQVYDSSSRANHSRDLDGIFFCEIPWIINKNNLQPERLAQMRQHTNMLWPKASVKYASFYALGVDAFDLTHKLNKMLMLPQLSTLGATGTLTLTPSHHIYRELPWALVKKGKPKLVS